MLFLVSVSQFEDRAVDGAHTYLVPLSTDKMLLQGVQ